MSPAETARKNTDATYWCFDSIAYLCEECFLFHNSLSCLAEHKVYPKEEIAGKMSLVAKAREVCAKHGLRLTHFCRAENNVCCERCISVDHIDTCSGKHDNVDDVAASVADAAISKLLLSVRTLNDEICTFMNVTDSFESEIDCFFQRKHKLIMETEQIFKRKILEKCDILVAESYKMAYFNLQDIESILSLLQQKRMSLTNALAILSASLNGSEIRFFLEKQKVKTIVLNVQKSIPTLLPENKNDISISFQALAILRNLCSVETFGSIYEVKHVKEFPCVTDKSKALDGLDGLSVLGKTEPSASSDDANETKQENHGKSAKPNINSIGEIAAVGETKDNVVQLLDGTADKDLAEVRRTQNETSHVTRSAAACSSWNNVMLESSTTDTSGKKYKINSFSAQSRLWVSEMDLSSRQRFSEDHPRSFEFGGDTFSLLTTIDIERGNSHITGCSWVSENEILVVDANLKRRYTAFICNVLTKKIIKKIRLKHKPFDVTVTADNECVISFPQEEKILVYDVNDFSEVDDIDVDFHCHGVYGMDNGMIITAGDENIAIFDNDFVLKKDWTVDGENIRYVCAGNINLIFYSELQECNIYRIHGNGDTLFRYHDDDMKGAAGLIMDGNKDIYVCEKGSNYLWVLDKKCNFIQKIDIGEIPTAISLSKEGNKICVIRGGRNSANVADIYTKMTGIST